MSESINNYNGAESGHGSDVTDYSILEDVAFAGDDATDDGLDAAISAAEQVAVPTLEDYLRDARRNLLAMSRTAQGVVDTSASAGKADAMTGVTGDQAADLAQQNYDAAIRLAYEHKDRIFASPQDLRGFVETLASTINQGIVKDGSLIRSSDSDKYPYVRIANLENYADKFYNGLYERTQDSTADPVEAAAYAEFGIDFAGHFFADGCGKAAKAVSAYMLMRADHPLPEYQGGRAAYYAHQLPQIAGEDPAADAAGYAKFLTYYRGLFDEPSEPVTSAQFTGEDHA